MSGAGAHARSQANSYFETEMQLTEARKQAGGAATGAPSARAGGMD